jgi:hypothetical protein
MKEGALSIVDIVSWRVKSFSTAEQTHCKECSKYSILLCEQLNCKKEGGILSV